MSMTPDRTAALEQAVGKLAEHLLWIYEVGVGNIDGSLLKRQQQELSDIARQFSQPEVNRDEG